MTKKQKKLMGEINHCNDLSLYRDKIHHELVSGKNHDLINSLKSYTELHHKKRIGKRISKREKSTKLLLKDKIIQQLKAA